MILFKKNSLQGISAENTVCTAPASLQNPPAPDKQRSERGIGWVWRMTERHLYENIQRALKRNVVGKVLPRTWAKHTAPRPEHPVGGEQESQEKLSGSTWVKNSFSRFTEEQGQDLVMSSAESGSPRAANIRWFWPVRAVEFKLVRTLAYLPIA